MQCTTRPSLARVEKPPMPCLKKNPSSLATLETRYHKILSFMEIMVHLARDDHWEMATLAVLIALMVFKPV